MREITDTVPEQQLQHWHAVLDSVGEGIWAVNLKGECTFVNQQAVKTFGFFNDDEMVGKNMHALVHHHYPDGRVFPDSECPVTLVLSNNTSLRRVKDLMFRRDGSSFVAEISAQPVRVDDRLIGLVVTFRDVTELLKQQEELQKLFDLAENRTAQLDAVIESMPHGVYVATTGSAAVRCNHRARNLAGNTFPIELKTLDRALEGESSTETARVGRRWIRSVGAPIVLKGKILGGVVVNTDVTQIQHQEEALRRSEKLAAVGQLASSIAHEINNPLESITNLLYLMRHSEVMDDVQQYAQIAQEELARVTEITLQTLRFHRQQSRAVAVDIGELLRTVMLLYTGRLLVRNVDVELKLMDVPRVICLEGEIRQVVNNLVRNALDAMSVEGGRLVVRLHRECHPRSRRIGVRLTVADTGEGIRPEIRACLFEPFQTTKEQTGTGLGLWVSKGIVEKHGGYIRVRSRRDDPHGTVFTVWLPVDSGFNLIAGAG